jgi:hypothetical protein
MPHLNPTLATRLRPLARALAVSNLPVPVRALAWQWLANVPPCHAAHAHAMRAPQRQPRPHL